MGLPEESSHSFIVRVWLEEVTDAGGVWRGQMTHVPSGTQRHFEELGELCRFVGGYLEAMGVRRPYGPDGADGG